MKKSFYFLIIIIISIFSEIYSTMFNTSDAQFVGVGNILIKEDQVLLVFRAHTGRNDHLYSLIGGLVKPTESVKQAAIREIYEEIGVIVDPADLELVHCMSSFEQNTPVIGIYFLVKKWEGIPYNKATENMIIYNGSPYMNFLMQ